MDNDTKYIAYLLLKNEYAKRNNINDLSDEDVMKNYNKYFPQDWEIIFNVDRKIELLTIALKNNLNLIEVYESQNNNYNRK